MMLELMLIQDAVLLCSSSKKKHNFSQNSSITALGKTAHESICHADENPVYILDKPTVILEVLFISFCRFVASHQIMSYPAEGAICGMLDG